MNLIEAPVLAMPVRPESPLSFRQFIRLPALAFHLSAICPSPLRDGWLTT
jgi:hypothetical protein